MRFYLGQTLSVLVQMRINWFCWNKKCPRKSFLSSPGHFFLSSPPFHSIFIFPFFFSKFRIKEGKKEDGEEGISFPFFSQFLSKKKRKREKMNCMNTKEGEKERFRSALEEGKQDRENTKKTSFIRRWTRSFHFLFHFHFFSIHEERIKEVTFERMEEKWGDKKCSGIFLLACLGQFLLSSSLPISPPQKEEKTENQKGFQEEKRKKIKKKKRKNFLRFFPVDPLIFLPKKKGM